jgi:hypothetical protein
MSLDNLSKTMEWFTLNTVTYMNQKLRIEYIVTLKNSGMYMHAKYSNMSVAETVIKQHGINSFRQWGHGWIATASGFTAWGLHTICSWASGAFLLSTGGNSYCHGCGVETCWHCRGAHAEDARACRRNRCLRRSIHPLTHATCCQHLHAGRTYQGHKCQGVLQATLQVLVVTV